MKRWIGWALVALLALGIGLIATLPAAVAWRHIAAHVPDLTLDAPSGSVWNGRASGAKLRGAALGALSWQLSPWSLLSTPTAQLTLAGGSVDFVGTARFANSEIELSDVTASTDAEWLAPALAIPELTPEGTVDIALKRLAISSAGIPTAIVGTATWRNAAVNGRVRAELGVIELSARSSGDAIVVTARDDGRGALIVNGAFEIRGAAYNGRIALTPRSSDEALIAALQWIGAPQPDGSRLLLVEGQIHPTEVNL